MAATPSKNVSQQAETIPTEKAVLVIAGGKTKKVPVQFNPSEYRLSERTSFSERTRAKQTKPHENFKGKPEASLSVKLYFDSDESTAVFGEDGSKKDKNKDIPQTIEEIFSSTDIDGEKHRPPDVMFIWGSLQFSGHAESVVVTYTMFDNKGKPLRAVVDLTIKGERKDSKEQNSPYSSPDRTKARMMTEDTNIWNIAEKEYGDVREWRRIADANDIMNPLDVPVGKLLRVPAIEDH